MGIKSKLALIIKNCSSKIRLNGHVYFLPNIDQVKYWPGNKRKSVYNLIVNKQKQNKDKETEK